MPEPGKEKPRTIVYVDGFNLYKGSIQGTPHKWLNIQRYFELLRQHEEVILVYYFTAIMDGAKGRRQEIYIKALETLAKVRVIVGRYKRKTVQCRVRGCTWPNQKFFSTWEEKHTDVNIAIQMLDDAYRDQCDVMVLVSGDSDLVPALNRVKQRFPHKKLVVYVPARDRHRGAAVEIRSSADKDATLPMSLLSKCHLPTEVDDGAGGRIVKPSAW